MNARVLALCGLALWPAAARAQDSARATAVQLFDEAELLMEQRDFAHACPKYAASMKLDPQLGALLHLADCYEKNGQLASAWGSFRQAQEMAESRGDPRATLAKDYAARLAPRLSRLTVTVPGASRKSGLQIDVDGLRLIEGAWGTPNPIDAGEHVIKATAPGHEPWSTTVSVAGDKQFVNVDVPELRALPGPRNDADAADATRGPFPVRTLGWVGVGVGAVGLGLGTFFLVQRHDKLDERDGVCPDRVCTDTSQGERIKALTREARKADTFATVGFIAGGAFVAGGVAAILLAPRVHSEADTAWLAPAITPQGYGLAGGTTW